MRESHVCYCRSQQPTHKHVAAYHWYEKRVQLPNATHVDTPKSGAWLAFAGIMYKLGITIFY